MKKKIIPIGYEDFKELIDKNLYFVDKSPMIKELLDSAGKSILLTRPRRFGKTLNLSLKSAKQPAYAMAYWSNTSSNSIVRELIEEADSRTRAELEALMDGGTIEKPVHEEITYGDIHTSNDNLWNFLFFTGYLKACGQRQEAEQVYLQMEIPNKEIRSIYRQSILVWFEKKWKAPTEVL